MGGWEARKFFSSLFCARLLGFEEGVRERALSYFSGASPRNSKTRMKGVSTRHGNVSRPALRGLYCDVCVTRVLLLCEEEHVLSLGEF